MHMQVHHAGQAEMPLWQAHQRRPKIVFDREPIRVVRAHYARNDPLRIDEDQDVVEDFQRRRSGRMKEGADDSPAT